MSDDKTMSEEIGRALRDAVAWFVAAEAEVDRLHDRVATVAGEAFGPFPVQGVDENITAIERGIFEQRLEIARLGQDAGIASAALDYYMERLAEADDDVGIAEEPGHPVALTLDHVCDCCGAMLRAGEDVAHFDGEEPEDVAIMHWGPCPEPDLWRIEYQPRSSRARDWCGVKDTDRAMDLRLPYEEALVVARRIGAPAVRLLRVRKEPARG